MEKIYKVLVWTVFVCTIYCAGLSLYFGKGLFFCLFAICAAIAYFGLIRNQDE